jgi:hypothetical protein
MAKPHKATPERISALSDGVFAVLITPQIPEPGRQISGIRAFKSPDLNIQNRREARPLQF